MKKPLDTALDETLAREVGLRDGGIRALLIGRIQRLGSGYVITTRVINPEDGRTLAAVSHDVERASADADDSAAGPRPASGTWRGIGIDRAQPE
jgi:hypothetical protein